jgi:hypothetical protein
LEELVFAIRLPILEELVIAIRLPILEEFVLAIDEFARWATSVYSRNCNDNDNDEDDEDDDGVKMRRMLMV